MKLSGYFDLPYDVGVELVEVLGRDLVLEGGSVAGRCTGHLSRNDFATHALNVYTAVASAMFVTG